MEGHSRCLAGGALLHIVARVAGSGFILVVMTGLVISIVSVVLHTNLLYALADPFRPPPPPGMLDPQPTRVIPELTDAQKDQAKTILLATSLAQEIKLRGGSTKLDAMGPWFEDRGGTQKLLGVAANISLDPPQTIEADWPKVMRGPDGQPVFTHIHQKVINLRVIGALIDLDKNEVVGVEFVDYNSPFPPLPSSDPLPAPVTSPP